MNINNNYPFQYNYPELNPIIAMQVENDNVANEPMICPNCSHNYDIINQLEYEITELNATIEKQKELIKKHKDKANANQQNQPNQSIQPNQPNQPNRHITINHIYH